MWPSAYRLCRRRIEEWDWRRAQGMERIPRSSRGGAPGDEPIERSFRTHEKDRPDAVIQDEHPTKRAMSSESKLPFDSAAAGVGARSTVSPDAPSSASPNPSSDKPAPEMFAETSPPGTPLKGSPATEQRKPASPESVSRGQLWLRRLGVLVFVFLCATVGVMLMLLPWRPEWSENPLLLRSPMLHDLIASGFTRGVVTGLGLLNVWIGFWEALQYRED